MQQSAIYDKIRRLEFIENDLKNVGWSFDSEDNLNCRIELTDISFKQLQLIQQKRQQQHKQSNFQLQTSDQIQLTKIVSKVKVQLYKKTELETLRNKSQNTQLNYEETKTLYNILAEHLIKIKMGEIFLYNYQIDEESLPQNGFTLSILQSQMNLNNKNLFDKIIIRWGKIFEFEALSLNQYIRQEQNIQSVNLVNFYILFTLERLLLMKWIFNNRKSRYNSFPLQYCYLIQIQETIEFSIDFLNSTIANKLANSIQDFQIDIKYVSQILLMQQHFQQKYKCSQSIFHLAKNIFIPFLFSNVNDDNLIQFEYILVYLAQSNEQFNLAIYYFCDTTNQDPDLYKKYFSKIIILFLKQLNPDIKFASKYFWTNKSVNPYIRASELTNQIEKICFETPPYQQFDELIDEMTKIQIDNPVEFELIVPDETFYQRMLKKI